MPRERSEKQPYRRSDLPDRRAEGVVPVETDPHVEKAVSFLEQALGSRPEILIVLGSGLSSVADRVEDPVELGFTEVPGLPSTGVAGHPGRLVGGRIGGREVLVQAGRYHLYEGHPRSVVERPVRIAAALGFGTAVLTNSSGGITPAFAPGEIAVIRDHIDFQTRVGERRRAGWRERGKRHSGRGQWGDRGGHDISLLRGPEPRSTWFDPGHVDATREAARELGLRLEPAVYAGVLGPAYETPAEIRMMRSAGADLVGMSTVPEARAAVRAGMRVLGLSVVANRAAGLSDERLTHEDVLRAGEEGAGRLARLIPRLLERL